MVMNRKIVSLVLTLILLLSVGAAPAEEAFLPQVEEGFVNSLITVFGSMPADDLIGLQEGEILTVGTPTEMSGIFAMTMFGNNTADIDVRNLLHGYSTVTWLHTAQLMFNGSCVAAVQAEADFVGNHTYTFYLMKDLVYNDGTPITAKDYLFSLLMSATPEITALGGQPRDIVHFLGYEEFRRGETTGISGVRLLSDDSFSLTVSGAYLPYFYGFALMAITPYPIHVIAPGCDVLDDGEGAYIGMSASAAELSAEDLGFEPGVYSVEMLQKTLLDPDTGYLYYPRVSSGPYSLESYDKDTQAVSFVVNPLYHGNYEGKKPHIERIVFQYVPNQDMVEALASGKVDLVNKALNGVNITEMLAMVQDEENGLSFASYPRAGLAYLAFACEQGVTADVAVRQAITQCFDREAFMAEVSPYAQPVHGYYGIGQWVTTYVSMEEDEEGSEPVLPPVNIMEEAETLAKPYNPSAATALLANAGWRYNEAGETYSEGVRYRKEEDGGLTPLIVHWAKTNDDLRTTDVIQAFLEEGFAEVGIGLEVTEMPFVEMLEYYYRIRPRTFDMFFMGSNFLEVFDPYFDYHTAEAFQGLVNTSGLRDEELMMLALDMRTTPAAETHLYALKWLAFQRRWVELMPLAPLYTNIYFDFFTDKLQDYSVAQNMSWALSIPYAWLGEPPETVFDGLPVIVEDPFIF